jgi:uncharacterized protein YpmS
MLSKKKKRTTRKERAKKFRLFLLCTRPEKGTRKKNNKQYSIQTPEKQKKINRRVTVYLTSVQKKGMEQEVTLSVVEGGRDGL